MHCWVNRSGKWSNNDMIWPLRVLTAKYGGWKCLVKGTPRLGASIIWQSLHHAAQWATTNVTWTLGDGNTILFWHDKWLGTDVLSRLTLTNVPVDQHHYTVRQYWSHQDGWHLHLLVDLLPQSIMDQLSLNTPAPPGTADAPRWNQTDSGLFSVKSAENMRLPATHDSPHNLWRTIWRFKGPPRASLTL